MNLHSLLRERSAAGRQVRAALIGAGNGWKPLPQEETLIACGAEGRVIREMTR